MGRMYVPAAVATVAMSTAVGVLVGSAGAQEAPAPPDAPSGAVAAPVVAEFHATGSVTYGDAVRVRGRIAPAAAGTVVIQRLQGRRWLDITTMRADGNGRFRADLPLRRSAALRVSILAAEGSAAPGPRRNVTVRRRIAATVAADDFGAIAGRPMTVTGTVVPSRDGERVVLEGSRDGRAFTPLARLSVTAGRVGGRVVPPAGGRWRFRLVAGRDARAGDVGRSAPTAAQPVHAVNPHGVPASEPVYLVQKLSETQLYYYERGRLVRVLPVVFGKPSTPTPTGRFRVYSKTVGPGPAFGPLALWYHGNYGIHGTNQEHLLDDPWRYYSHGCTRNYNVNILWLWDRVPVGTPVRNIA